MNKEYENELLKKLESSTGDNYKETLVDLVQLYRSIGKPGKAFKYINTILDIYYENWNATAHDLFPNDLCKNECFNYSASLVSFYSKGDDPETQPSKHWQYRINDCFSFCLNLLGRHKEAETICRENIELYPLYSYAYINLGISLEGQGCHYEAADSYRTALIADFHHGHARERFYYFLEKHPEVRINMPEIEEITVDERNEFQKMHGSDNRWSVLFSGEVKGEDIGTILEECSEKIHILEENNKNIRNKDEVKH
jgi:tetratricopeptide (TPR) repeat protein